MDWIKEKISRKTFALMLVTVIIPLILIGIVTYVQTRNVVRDMMVQETEQLFSEGKRSLTNYFEDIDQASLFIYHNQLIEKSLSTVLDGDYDAEAERFFMETLSTVRAYEDEIVQVYLGIEAFDRTFLLREYMLADQRARMGTIVYDMDQDAMLYPVHTLEDYGILHVMTLNGRVVSYVRNLYEVPSKEVIGQIVIDLDSRVFEKLLSELYREGEALRLIDLTKNIILFSTDQEEIGQSLESDLLERSIGQRVSYPFSYEYDDQLFVSDRISTDYMDLLLLKGIPTSSAYDNLNDSLSLIAVLVTLMIIIVSVGVTINSFYMTAPIGSLLATIRRIRKGDIRELAEVTNEDEFGQLQQHFNEMMLSINEHIDMEYRLKMENTRSELKALQSQINSHFMNNTLQSIGTETLREGNKKAYNLIVMLGEMMQYSMRHQKTIVTLEEEIRYCHHYLELQKNRFQERFSYDLEVSSDLEQCLVPKMLIQPLVENSFIHGFTKAVTEGKIIITIVEEKDQIVLNINDNGVGVDPETVKELNRKLRETSLVEESSIGLINVNQRLKLYFGQEASITIDSALGKGFRSRTVLPKVYDLKGIRTGGDTV